MEHREQRQCRVGTHLGPGAAREPTMQREPGLGHAKRVLWTKLEGTRAGCAFCNVLCAHRLPAVFTGCPGCEVMGLSMFGSVWLQALSVPHEHR